MAMDPAMRAGVAQALGAWSAVADIRFTEVPDTGAGGDMRFGRHTMDPGGYAYFPTFATSLGGAPLRITAASPTPLGATSTSAPIPAMTRWRPAPAATTCWCTRPAMRSA
ncbi:hypothetical protein ACFQY5_20970 [Paeniroseomonas aquatica]|uniref:hypothetical protein n=1 Tax=Paeniroseomonas aquatica TaxID=373043 RepID=UPI00360CB8EF